MSRTIKQIYEESVKERNRRLELSEFSSDSKLSIMNGITWTVAAGIYTFETLLDVFAVDISNVINSRVNGTPAFYVNALLQYQKGDELTVREDGLAFGYASMDEGKRIITQASYSENTKDENIDNKLILKVATGTAGELHALDGEELPLLRAYIDKIKFAGTRVEITSLEGDVLIPRVSVYYDGAVPESGMYDNIEQSLKNYIMNTAFDSTVYVSDIIAAIRAAEHVTDVYIDPAATPQQGIFIASYDADGHITPTRRIGRMTQCSSGYLKESSGKGEEKELPGFRQAVKLIIDRDDETL